MHRVLPGPAVSPLCRTPPSWLWSCYGTAGSLRGPDPSPAARLLAPVPRARALCELGCRYWLLPRCRSEPGGVFPWLSGTRTRCACAVSVPRAGSVPGTVGRFPVDPVSPSAGRGRRAVSLEEPRAVLAFHSAPGSRCWRCSGAMPWQQPALSPLAGEEGGTARGPGPALREVRGGAQTGTERGARRHLAALWVSDRPAEGSEEVLQHRQPRLRARGGGSAPQRRHGGCRGHGKALLPAPSPGCLGALGVM